MKLLLRIDLLLPWLALRALHRALLRLLVERLETGSRLKLALMLALGFITANLPRTRKVMLLLPLELSLLVEIQRVKVVLLRLRL